MNTDQIAAEALKQLDELPVDCVIERIAIIKSAIEKAIAPVEKLRDEWCEEYIQMRDQLAATRELVASAAKSRAAHASEIP